MGIVVFGDVRAAPSNKVVFGKILGPLNNYVVLGTTFSAPIIHTIYPVYNSVKSLMTQNTVWPTGVASIWYQGVAAVGGVKGYTYYNLHRCYVAFDTSEILTIPTAAEMRLTIDNPYSYDMCLNAGVRIHYSSWGPTLTNSYGEENEDWDTLTASASNDIISGPFTVDLEEITFQMINLENINCGGITYMVITLADEPNCPIPVNVYGYRRDVYAEFNFGTSGIGPRLYITE